MSADIGPSVVSAFAQVLVALLQIFGREIRTATAHLRRTRWARAAALAMVAMCVSGGAVAIAVWRGETRPLAVVSPGDGACVERSERVRAHSPFHGRHHYWMVIPGDERQFYLQPNVPAVDNAGTLTGEVVFGKPADYGARFRLGILASDTALDAERVFEIPAGAIVSQMVSVRRANDGGCVP